MYKNKSFCLTSDLLRLFGGEFTDVYSIISNDYWKYDVEDNAQGEIVGSGIDEDLPLANGFNKSRDYNFEGIQL